MLFSRATAPRTARRPLFDRLVDDNPQEKEEKKIKDRLDMEGLQSSISRELKMVLNTRSATRDRQYREYPAPGDFGLEDYTHLSPSRSDGAKISRNLINAILTYEPRLLKPMVRIVCYDKLFQKMFIEIQGMIKLGERLERFSFPLDLQIK
jgi:type VI secretion system lysozyme-like protein